MSIYKDGTCNFSFNEVLKSHAFSSWFYYGLNFQSSYFAKTKGARGSTKTTVRRIMAQDHHQEVTC